jgi:hypothetical protein
MMRNILILISLILVITVHAELSPAIIQKCQEVLAIVETNKGTSTALCIDSSGYFLVDAGIINENGNKLNIIVNPGTAQQEILPAKVATTNREIWLALLKVEANHPLPCLNLYYKGEYVETQSLTIFAFPFSTRLDFQNSPYPNLKMKTGTIMTLYGTNGVINSVRLDADYENGFRCGIAVDDKGEVAGIINAPFKENYQQQRYNDIIKGMVLMTGKAVIKAINPVNVQSDKYTILMDKVNEPLDYSFTITPLLPAYNNFTAEVTMRGTKDPKVYPAVSLGENKYQAKIIPQEKTEIVDELSLGVNYRFNSFYMNIKNFPFKVDDKEIQINDVYSIEMGSPAKVTTTNKEIITGKVTGLEAVKGKNLTFDVTMNLQDADKIFIKKSNQPSQAERGSYFIYPSVIIKSDDDDVRVSTVNNSSITVVKEIVKNPGNPGINPGNPAFNPGNPGFNPGGPGGPGGFNPGGVVFYPGGYNNPRPKPNVPENINGNIRISNDCSSDDIVTGGYGRYIFFIQKKKWRIIVFDMKERKIIKTLEMPTQNTLLAAGRDKFVMILPEEFIIRRFNYTTFECDMNDKINVSNVIKIGMGASSNGPLYMMSKNRDNFITLIDLNTLKIKPVIHENLKLNTYATTNFRISENGNVITAWYVLSNYTGMNKGILKNNTITWTSMDINAGPTMPTDDGSLLFSSVGIFDNSFKLAAGEKFQKTNCVLGYGGQYFVGIVENKVTVYAMAGFQELHSYTINLSWRKQWETFSENTLFDKVIAYFPEYKTLMTVDSAGMSMVLNPIDVNADMKAAGKNYLYVRTSPDLRFKTGTKYSCLVDVQSSCGIDVYSLDQAPEGMKISQSGLIEWQVPEDYKNREETVIISMVDAFGQTCLYPYKITAMP